MKILFTLLLFLIVFSVYARDINVKYRDGAVNVDNGNFVEFDLKSSSLDHCPLPVVNCTRNYDDEL